MVAEASRKPLVRTARPFALKLMKLVSTLPGIFKLRLYRVFDAHFKKQQAAGYCRRPVDTRPVVLVVSYWSAKRKNTDGCAGFGTCTVPLNVPPG